MDEWAGTWVMPNVRLRDAIEFGPAALVPIGDFRAQALIASHPHLSEYVARFRDAFQVQLSPGLLIVRTDAPKSFLTVEAVASLRDVLSICVIPYSIALTVKYGNMHRITFSNFFDYHPWHLDREYNYLRIETPASQGLHDVLEFAGQSSPELHVSSLLPSDIDSPLLDTLVRRWRRRYSGRSIRWEDRKLFRSLNMASEAARTPGSADTTMYDVGRLIFLWVSALEILAHPRVGTVGMKTVIDGLEKVEYVSDFRRHRRYKVQENRQGTKYSYRGLAPWICWKLYQIRNDFIHGNPVSWRSLRIRETTLALSYYAACIYRLALTAALPLTFPKPSERLPLMDYARKHWDRSEYLEYQELIERALRTAVRKPTREIL